MKSRLTEKKTEMVGRVRKGEEETERGKGGERGGRERGRAKMKGRERAGASKRAEASKPETETERIFMYWSFPKYLNQPALVKVKPQAQKSVQLPT